MIIELSHNHSIRYHFELKIYILYCKEQPTTKLPKDTALDLLMTYNCPLCQEWCKHPEIKLNKNHTLKLRDDDVYAMYCKDKVSTFFYNTNLKIFKCPFCQEEIECMKKQ